MTEKEEKELRNKLHARTHEDAMKEASRLQERSGILAMVMEALGVDDHWDVPEAFNRALERITRRKKK